MESIVTTASGNVQSDPMHSTDFEQLANEIAAIQMMMICFILFNPPDAFPGSRSVNAVQRYLIVQSNARNVQIFPVDMMVL